MFLNVEKNIKTQIHVGTFKPHTKNRSKKVEQKKVQESPPKMFTELELSSYSSIFLCQIWVAN